MPILQNPRHEAFAQEVAKGKSADAAYRSAGYKPDRGNASRLTANDSIRARLAELQGQAAERALVTTESLIAEADRLMRLAMEKAQFSPAVSALTLKAKLAGLLERPQPFGPGLACLLAGCPALIQPDSWIRFPRVAELAAGFSPLRMRPV